MRNVPYAELQQLCLTVTCHFAITSIYPKQTTGYWIALGHSNRGDFERRAALFLAFTQCLLRVFHVGYIMTTAYMAEKFSIFREPGSPVCIHPTPLAVSAPDLRLCMKRFALAQCFIIGIDISRRVIRMKQRRPFRSPHILDRDTKELTIGGIEKLDTTSSVSHPD